MIEKYIARKFKGGSGDLQNVCPGEIACEKFETAAGKTREEKEQNACIPCELFPTKLNPDTPKEIEKVLSRILFLRQSILAGFPKAEDDITAIEYRGLLIFDNRMRELELQIQIESLQQPKMF